MAMRPVDKGTPLMLRTKAATYAKEIGLCPEQLSLVINGSIALAMVPSLLEYDSYTGIATVFGERLVNWSSRLRSGLLQNNTWFNSILDWVAVAVIMAVLAVVVVKTGLGHLMLLGLKWLLPHLPTMNHGEKLWWLLAIPAGGLAVAVLRGSRQPTTLALESA
jgi:hypothetical protein